MSRLLNDNDQSQTRNMFLAIVLALGVILVWQAFMTPPMPPPPPAATADDSTPAAQTADPPSAAATVDPTAPTAAAPTIPQNEPLPPQRITGTNHNTEVTNVGGRIAGVEILSPEQYQLHTETSGVFPFNGDDALPMSIQIGGLPDLTESTVYALDELDSERDADGDYSRVTYRWTSPDGSIRVTRRYFADPLRPFALGMEIQVENLSQTSRRFEHLETRVYGKFDKKGGGIFDQSGSALEGICVGAFGTERRMARKIENERAYGSADSAVEFAGVDERYFLSALIPQGDTQIVRCAFRPVDADHVMTALSTSSFDVAGGASQTFEFLIYTGPKHEGFLKADDMPGNLYRSVDFGWFSFLALPIRFFLVLFQGWVGNWGIAIILLTLFVKILLLPITQKGYESMEKMKKVQPKLQALQKKYENDKAKLAEEQMALFKTEGVNPISGCLPMVAQMPIYIALYRTIWGSAELYNAPFFLWVHDLSQPDPFFILPVLMGGVMWFQQKLMPQAIDNPQMQMVTRIMPWMFTVMMLFLPSGLVLYIFVNMLLSIAQMLYIRRKYDTGPVEAVGATRHEAAKSEAPKNETLKSDSSKIAPPRKSSKKTKPNKSA